MKTATKTNQRTRHAMTLPAIIFICVMFAFSVGCVTTKTHNTCLEQNQLFHEQVQRLDAENDVLATKLVLKATAASVINSLYQELVVDLKDKILDHRITINQMKSGVVISLTEKVLFPSGTVKLSDEGSQMLTEVGKDLSEVPFQVLVIGFTDNVPVGPKLKDSYPTNWELAGARAALVVRMLEKVGVAKEQLRAVSKAENMPVASNDTPEGRAENRRIEIRLRPVVIEE
jgi:chemotaxis protein MotB